MLILWDLWLSWNMFILFAEWNGNFGSFGKNKVYSNFGFSCVVKSFFCWSRLSNQTAQKEDIFAWDFRNKNCLRSRFELCKKNSAKLFSLTLPVLCISESCIEIKNWLKFLLSHFFVVLQKVLWRPLRPS